MFFKVWIGIGLNILCEVCVIVMMRVEKFLDGVVYWDF